MKKYLIIFILISFKASSQVSSDEVWKKIDEIDQLRVKLATLIKPKTTITAAQFTAVCIPVGMKTKSYAENQGWLFKQISHKNRNENNYVDENAREHYEKFIQNASTTSDSYFTIVNGVSGTRYLKKIVVGNSCLTCHGDKNTIPEFIRNKYPNDKAFDFKVGDLRGVYSVFIPSKK